MSELRRRPGEVRDAIVEALHGISDGATLSELSQRVEELLDVSVPSSSIRSYLNLNTPEVFERVARGRYRLQADRVPGSSTSSWPAYTAGRARLIMGDSFEWLAAQPSNSIEGVVTDPPYGLVEYSPVEQAKLRKGHGGVWRIPPAYDGHVRSPLPRFTTLSDAELREIGVFFRRFGESLLRVVVPGGHVLIASNPLVSHRVGVSLELSGFERRGEVIRLVQTMRGGDRPKNAETEFTSVTVMPRSQWEPWLLFRKPLDGTVAQNLRRWKTGGLRRVSVKQPFGDVIRSAPTRPVERSVAPHPSLKPQAFLRQVVRAILPLGEGTVLDPFAGSGSTLAAAEAIGYHSIGIERDEKYFKLAQSGIGALSTIVVV